MIGIPLNEMAKPSEHHIKSIQTILSANGLLKKEAELLNDLLEKKNCDICNTAGANFNETLIKEKINSISFILNWIFVFSKTIS